MKLLEIAKQHEAKLEADRIAWRRRLEEERNSYLQVFEKIFGDELDALKEAFDYSASSKYSHYGYLITLKSKTTGKSFEVYVNEDKTFAWNGKDPDYHDKKAFIYDLVKYALNA